MKMSFRIFIFFCFFSFSLSASHWKFRFQYQFAAHLFGLSPRPSALAGQLPLEMLSNGAAQRWWCHRSGPGAVCLSAHQPVSHSVGQCGAAENESLVPSWCHINLAIKNSIGFSRVGCVSTFTMHCAAGKLLRNKDSKSAFVQPCKLISSWFN